MISNHTLCGASWFNIVDCFHITTSIRLWALFLSHAFPGKLLLNLMDHTDIVRDLTFAPDGSLMLVSASRDKTLRVWDLKDDGMDKCA